MLIQAIFTCEKRNLMKSFGKGSKEELEDSGEVGARTGRAWRTCSGERVRET